MTLTHFIILTLATWRLAVLLTMESGPGRLCGRFRDLVTESAGQHDGSLGELVTCPYCISIWLGLVVAACYLFWPLVMVVFCLPLAIAGGCSALQQLTYHKFPAVEAPPGPPEGFDDMLEG